MSSVLIQRQASLRKSGNYRVLFCIEDEFKSDSGAGRLVVVNYPPIQFPDFEVTRIPRETRKTLEPAESKC